MVLKCTQQKWFTAPLMQTMEEVQGVADASDLVLCSAQEIFIKMLIHGQILQKKQLERNAQME